MHRNAKCTRDPDLALKICHFSSTRRMSLLVLPSDAQLDTALVTAISSDPLASRRGVQIVSMGVLGALDA
jgi:hypothetical protein